MTIQVLLDSQAPHYPAIQKDLLTEMNALGKEQGVELTMRTAPPPEGTLPVAEVFQFVLQHKDAIIPTVTLATAVIQLVNAVLHRRQPKTDGKQEPPVLIVVGDHRLPLPASGERQLKFLRQLSGGGRAPSKPKGRKVLIPKKSSDGRGAKPRTRRR